MYRLNFLQHFLFQWPAKWTHMEFDVQSQSSRAFHTQSPCTPRAIENLLGVLRDTFAVQSSTRVSISRHLSTVYHRGLPGVLPCHCFVEKTDVERLCTHHPARVIYSGLGTELSRALPPLRSLSREVYHETYL